MDKIFGPRFRQPTFDIGGIIYSDWRPSLSSIPYFSTPSAPRNILTQNHPPSTLSAHMMAAPKRYASAVCIEYHTKRHFLINDDSVEKSIKLGTLCRLGEKIKGHLSRIAWLDERHPLDATNRKQMESMATTGRVPDGMSWEECISHTENYIETWIQYRTPVDNDNQSKPQSQYKTFPERAPRNEINKVIESVTDEYLVACEESDEEETANAVMDDDWDIITDEDTKAERRPLQRFSTFN